MTQVVIFVCLPGECAQCADTGADEGGFVVVRQCFKRKALQRAHLYHGLQVPAQHRDVEEADIVAGEVEAPRTSQVNERRRGRGQGTMPQVHELAAPLVALLGLREYFFRLAVKKTHAHGAVSHDAFQVTHAAASAKALLGVERDGDVAALPYAFDIRPPAVADAVADGPHAGEAVELTAGGGHSGGDRVSVLGNVDRGGEAPSREPAGQLLGKPHSFDLGQIGAVFHDAMADHAGHSDADSFDLGPFVASEAGDMRRDDLDQLAAGNGHQGVHFVQVFRIADRLASQLMILQPPSHNMFSHYHADRGSHCALLEDCYVRISSYSAW